MEYLYHYTNVDTLKLILESGKFRFNSLQNVDDLEEMETADFGNLGRFCYVSCWTDKVKESIPMWKEYTSPKKGLRIKLPKNIFEEVEDVGLSQEQLIKYNIKKEDLPKLRHQYTKGLAEYEKKNSVIFIPPTVELFPVTYTQDSKLLNYSVYNKYEKGFCIETKFLGKFKNIDWIYQSEWRYKLFAYPFGLTYIMGNFSLLTDPQRILNILKTVPIPCNYFDVPFKKKYLNEMEILTSPIFDKESRQLLNTITNTLSNVKIEQSTQRWIR